MDCNKFKTVVEPIDEKCCGDLSDVATHSSDCESCRSEVIPEIPVPDDSYPIVVTQCIWNPPEIVDTPPEQNKSKAPKSAPKRKRSPKKKASQGSIIESNDYNLPELSDFMILPLHDKDVASLTFGEILLISFLNENPLKCPDDLFNFKGDKYVTIGGFCINIQRDGRNIIVYSTSEFSCNGKATKGTIYSLCDTSLNIIEEKRTEAYIDQNGDKREKSLHLIKESIDGSNEKRVVAFRTENSNRLISKYHSKIKINVTGALVPDGLNFVLLRYLAILQYVGKFETWTINIKGHICRSEYIFKHRKMMKVNSTNTEVIQVIRHVTGQNEDPEIIKMYFLPTGHMIRHSWESYPFIIHINPLSAIPPSGFILNSFETWQQHIDLVSNYLDFKDNAQSKLKTYLNDKPEVRCIIKDYVALLLHMKPASILGLTMEYFMNLNGDVQNVNEESDEESESDSYNENNGSSDNTDEEQLDEPDDKSDIDSYH